MSDRGIKILITISIMFGLVVGVFLITAYQNREVAAALTGV
jgi:tetrahydromethanopterin S-methyltransferase subunit G